MQTRTGSTDDGTEILPDRDAETAAAFDDAGQESKGAGSCFLRNGFRG